MNKQASDGFKYLVARLKAVEPDKRFRAYILATVQLECGNTWQPIKERGNDAYFKKYEPPGLIAHRLGNVKLGDGKKYTGKGYCQITGRRNYTLFSKLLGIDLVNNPDLALNKDIAFDILYLGMTKGLFTGKKLSDYFSRTDCDFLHARRIINGMDKAETIASYAKAFYSRNDI